ncbi:hypothetical protein BCV70DRAFT_205344 [Testicularia cyperi]|uniref:Uncharacterized protein n=1 Tax=Testicularia cyperi TaxID=1882483 RepID=A0A317XTI9_9BASI|nr:hypothetical protein BCV70DRAFT_205344 [Testicularia cyperi]
MPPKRTSSIPERSSLRRARISPSPAPSLPPTRRRRSNHNRQSSDIEIDDLLPSSSPARSTHSQKTPALRPTRQSPTRRSASPASPHRSDALEDSTEDSDTSADSNSSLTLDDGEAEDDPEFTVIDNDMAVYVQLPSPSPSNNRSRELVPGRGTPQASGSRPQNTPTTPATPSSAVSTASRTALTTYPMPDNAVCKVVSDFPPLTAPAPAGFVVADTACSHCQKAEVHCTLGTGFNSRGKPRKTACDYCNVNKKGRCNANEYRGRMTRNKRLIRSGLKSVERLQHLLEQHVAIPAERRKAMEYLRNIDKAITKASDSDND